MSQQYDNNMRGVLFKNDRKQNDNHPDYQGSITVNGEEMWLSAWIKQGKSGKFMSLSVKPKEEQRQQRPAPPARNNYAEQRGGSGFDSMDSDIPF